MKYFFSGLIVLLVFWTLKDMWQSRRNYWLSQKSLKVVSGPDNTWRWPLPDKKLALEPPIQLENQSVLYLPGQTLVNFQRKTVYLGYFFLLATLVFLIYLLLLPERWFFGLFIAGSLASVGWPALMFQAFLGRIDFCPDEIRFFLRYGIWWVREFRFSRKQFAKFGLESQVLPTRSLNASEEQPLFLLKMKKFNQNYRWLSGCNPEQGQWLEMQLQAWQKQSITNQNELP